MDPWNAKEAKVDVDLGLNKQPLSLDCLITLDNSSSSFNFNNKTIKLKENVEFDLYRGLVKCKWILGKHNESKEFFLKYVIEMKEQRIARAKERIANEMDMKKSQHKNAKDDAKKMNLKKEIKALDKDLKKLIELEGALHNKTLRVNVRLWRQVGKDGTRVPVLSAWSE